ncbi:protein FAR1-RELATED SEQUENCE 5-like [Lolium perenne]|uniref:protein FAR1-RELATED SEQUENCE 5-like n=1 Tax=Lolium perenne TaxID=4522 RepID=UPI003A990491
MPRARGFEYWFGGIDLNATPEASTSTDQHAGQPPEVGGHHVDPQGDEAGPSNNDQQADSRAQTGVTLSSEESDGEAEVESTPEGYVPKVPFVGMMFDTPELALQHYNRYAHHIGFSVKIESSRRCAKDGELDKFVYVCNKSGKPREEEAVPVKQRNRKLTVLTDCKAKLRVKRDGARWKVTQFVEVHTHEVIDKFALKKYLRSHNKIPAEEKKFIDLLHEVNLTSGRIMEIMGELYGSKQNVPYNSKTVSNYTAKLGNYDRIKDIPELLEYFEEIKKDDPRFFYRFKLDAENKVENLLRYGQSIQLGCGFVRNESSVNFVWLFERFLEAMDGLHPLNIITDQDAAIRTAILIVFISIIHSMTPEEFEQRWANMVETHGVADNTHFLDLYDLREYFVPAYFRHRFFPFLQTTSRSEGFNAVLKQYVHPHDSLVRFFKQYMKLQERIDVTEDAHEFDGDEKTVRLWGDFPMEKQILQTYTMPIYHRFQLELRKITSYNVRDIGVTEQGSIHEIFPIQGSVRGYGRRSYRVDADVANGIYNCECCKINRDGILCCHALKVMTHLGKKMLLLWRIGKLGTHQCQRQKGAQVQKERKVVYSYRNQNKVSVVCASNQVTMLVRARCD